MSSAMFLERKIASLTTKPSRPAFPAALLAALTALCSQASFAQMEHANAMVQSQNMATAAPAAAAAAAAVAPNPDCTLIVPHNPLTATGLATPFQLVATDPAGGPCNE